jgi:aminoglycoside phosphotransferase (APT) family kinase protein
LRTATHGGEPRQAHPHLKVEQIVPYLLERELLSEKTLVDERVEITSASRRNSNFIIKSQTGPSYVLKQASDADTRETVANEARIYQCIQSLFPESQESSLPQLHIYDADSCAVVLDYVVDSVSLLEAARQRNRFSVWVAAQLGASLARIHTRAKPPYGAEAPRHDSDANPPWALSALSRPDAGILRDVSHANLRLLEVIHRYSAFSAALDSLYEEWRPNTLIHHDLKFDNVLVHVAGQPFDGGGRVRIVDWEFAGLGDPCWDLGSVFADYLSFWILTIPVIGAASSDQLLRLARCPISRIQPSMQRFWRSYARVAHLDASSAADLLTRAMRFTAARLLQTAFEHTQASIELPGNVVCMLQVSYNMLQRPRDAALRFIGAT